MFNAAVWRCLNPGLLGNVAKVRRCCDGLVKRRLLLDEDANMLVKRAQRRNPLDPWGPRVPVLVAPGGDRIQAIHRLGHHAISQKLIRHPREKQRL